MAQITNFFLGANSGSGFQNLFSEIMDPETAFDIMILERVGRGWGRTPSCGRSAGPWSRRERTWSISGAPETRILWTAW
ncbi:MAG: hypothetical protein ACLSHO_08975 [Dysosmobacter sp.]